jgi:hypothetical protein
MEMGRDIVPPHQKFCPCLSFKKPIEGGKSERQKTKTTHKGKKNFLKTKTIK